MKLIVGSDEKTHLTDAVVQQLEKRGHLVELAGPLKGDPIHWARVAQQVAECVARGEADEGILFCWTGTGVSIAANKVPGIRAALAQDAETAKGARLWNRANVLCMSLRATSEVIANEILDAWFSTRLGTDPKDLAAIEHVSEIEKSYSIADKEGEPSFSGMPPIMLYEINDNAIELVEGDITAQDMDAIVNAANTSLLGGGGVDGAIHRAAGPGLLAECRTLGGCETGDAKLTQGYRLPAKFVIHAVGPVYNGGKHGEAELLASAYRRSLELATGQHIKSVAFPAISTGAFGYPLEAAARIALGTVLNYMQEHDEPSLVRLVLYDRQTYEVHERVMQELLAA